MKFRTFLRSILCATALGTSICASDACGQTLVITGGTLVDLSSYGHGEHDQDDLVIVVSRGVISAVGKRSEVTIPPDAQNVDASGKFIIPGLIDGFGSLRTQGFANAYLYEGVTSIFVAQTPSGEDGEQKLFEASSGPTVLRGQMVGGYSLDGSQYKKHPWTEHRVNDQRLSNDELSKRITAIADQGARGIILSYDLWPDQLDLIVREAHARHLITLGELAFTSYPYAIRASIDALPHNDRYLTAIASPQSLLAYMDDPVGMGGAPAYRDVVKTDVHSPAVEAYGNQLRAAHTALMPTLTIEATADDLDIPNPWSVRSSSLVRAVDLDDPVDPKTGARPFLSGRTAEVLTALKTGASHRQTIDAQLHTLGAHFLAGSGSPSYGIMPGGGLHQELKLLHRIGLTPREVLAAATSNFADVYGWNDLGRIEAGRRGDIVLLSSDPRSDVAALDEIFMVVHDGRIVDRDALLAKSKS